MFLKNKLLIIAVAGVLSIAAAVLIVKNSTGISNFFEKTLAREIASLDGVFGENSISPAASLTDDSFYKPCDFEADQIPSRDGLVFKEIAWMGDKDGTSNEWFSIQKIAVGSLDISGYQILNKNEKINIVIPKGTTLSDGNPIYF